MDHSPLKPPYQPLEELGEVRGNRRLQSKLRTRRKVMEAARRLFALRGYDAATVREIAREAGMSTGAVFANFQDKADLFEAVLLEDAALVCGRMRAASTRSGATAQRLVAVFSEGYAYHLDHLPLMRAILAQSWVRDAKSEERVRAAVREVLDIVAEILADGVRRGEVREGFDVATAVAVLFDLYIANYRRAVYDNWTLEAVQVRLAEQVDLVLGGGREAA